MPCKKMFADAWAAHRRRANRDRGRDSRSLNQRQLRSQYGEARHVYDALDESRGSERRVHAVLIAALIVALVSRQPPRAEAIFRFTVAPPTKRPRADVSFQAISPEPAGNWCSSRRTRQSSRCSGFGRRWAVGATAARHDARGRSLLVAGSR